MKKIGKKNLTKQIICIIIFLMMCNFIMPKYSYAVETEEGGSLIEVLAQFLCIIPDAVLGFLQDMFVTPDSIQQIDENYSIKYSPGIIFSGEIPAFDINFINPGEVKYGVATYTEYMSLIDSLDLNGAREIESITYAPGPFVTKNGSIKNIKKKAEYEYHKAREIDISTLEGRLQSNESNMEVFFGGNAWDSTTNTLEAAWYNEDETKVFVIVDYYSMTQNTDIYGNVSYLNIGIIKLYELDSNETLNNVTDDTQEKEITYTKAYQSTAKILQPIVATWYNALRRIALVGLLSAIVYIGIRIVLTSTSAKDKAKYKKMLKDWLVALCLLFTLHYIMSITITVVDNINDVVKASSIAPNGEDILMTSVRNRIFNLESWSEALTYVVIYDVLMVYTIIYTIQYIRRMIYLAFLTMIAPLITLTYPLDKIKDSKAQAFDMWIKDYVFFSLIQVVHLLIYYIFLGTTVSLANEGNWLFAIVTIGFIVPAEKLIKKMFGFEKSKTLGAMAAGATGALVMNAMQKLPTAGKGGSGGGAKASGNGQESTKPVRTAGVNPFVNFAGGDSENSSSSSSSNSSGPFKPGASSSGDSGSSTVGNNNGTTKQKNGKESKFAKIFKNKNFANNGSKALTSSELKRPKRRTFKGAMSVVGRYFPSIAGGSIRMMAGATGAIIGLSAGIAQGDMSKAFSGMAIGATAGSNVANKAYEGVRKLERVPEKVSEVADTWREGVYGKEAVQNARFDRAFRNSQEYQELQKFTGLPEKEFDKKIQIMLDSGISDTKKMKKILKNHKKDPKRYSMDKAIKYSKMADKCSEDILYDNMKFIRFCQDRKINLSEEDLNELRRDIMSFK